LQHRTWNFVARLGPGAFETIGGHVVNVALLALSTTRPGVEVIIAGVDVAEAKTAAEKAARLADCQPTAVPIVRQADQLQNPDAVVTTETVASDWLLSRIASSIEGLSTGDGDRYAFCFWEVSDWTIWERFQASPDNIVPYGGQHRVIRWEDGKGTLSNSSGA